MELDGDLRNVYKRLAREHTRRARTLPPLIRARVSTEEFVAMEFLLIGSVPVDFYVVLPEYSAFGRDPE